MRFSRSIVALCCAAGFAAGNHCTTRHNRILRSPEAVPAENRVTVREKVPAVWAFHERASYDSALFWRLLNKEKPEKDKLSFTEATHASLMLSNMIERHEHAPLRLEMESTYEKPGYGWTSLLCLLTLGIFPMVDAVERKTDFSLHDRGRETEVARYTYVYRDTIYYSWLTLPFNLLVTPFSKELNQQSNNKAEDTTAEAMTKIFEEDLARDLERKKFNEELVRANVVKPPMAVLRPVNRSPEPDSRSILRLAQTTLEDELVAYQLRLHNTDVPGASDDDSKDDFERFSKRCKDIARKTDSRFVVRLELLSSIFNPEKNTFVVTFQGQIADIQKDKYYNFGPIQFQEPQHSESSRKAGKFFAHRFVRLLQGFKGTRLAEIK